MTVYGQLCTIDPYPEESEKGEKKPTSFFIQLFQHFSDDLANTLQSLDVLFRDVEFSLQILDT